MADKHFGKGFATKHFADKHFAETSLGRVVDCNVALVAVATQQAQVIRGSERFVDASVALVTVTTQPASVVRARVVECATALVSVAAQQAQILRGGRQVDAAPALVAVQALPASVVRGRFVAAGVATVLVTAQAATIVRGASEAASFYVIEIDGLLPSAADANQGFLPPQSFSLQAGQFAQLLVSVRDSDGAAVDLSGGQARFVMKRKAGSAVVLDSSTGSATATIEAGGVVRCTALDPNTETLSGTYAWEVWFKDSGDRDVPVAKGYVTFKRSVRLAA